LIALSAALGLSGLQFHSTEQLVATGTDALDAERWTVIGEPDDARTVPGGMALGSV